MMMVIVLNSPFTHTKVPCFLFSSLLSVSSPTARHSALDSGALYRLGLLLKLSGFSLELLFYGCRSQAGTLVLKHARPEWLFDFPAAPSLTVPTRRRNRRYPAPVFPRLPRSDRFSFCSPRKPRAV